MVHGELDMFPRFLLFFLSTFAVIRIQFTLPKHGKHIHVTTMYCRSHDFGRDRCANLDVRLLMCAFETSGILSTVCQRLLMRFERCSGKKPEGSKRGVGLRYPVSTWRDEFDVVKRQSVGHYSLFSIANILNTWVKRINKLLVHQHLNCKTMQQTGDALLKYSSRLFDEATRRAAIRAGELGHHEI